jgi:peptide-methionine (S)-S-oxide reductase
LSDNFEKGESVMSWYARALAAATLVAALFGVGAGSVSAAEKAIFAGGCFWCMEEAFDKVPGVISVTSGYTGGHVVNPTYKQVSYEETGHYEAVEVEYDPAHVNYEQLLDTFWHNVDPLDARGQFCDKGSQYLSAIFVANDAEKTLAESTKAEVQGRFGQPVATEILAETVFYLAEGYHQGYYKTNSTRYNLYKFGCGRPQRLEELWGKPAA